MFKLITRKQIFSVLIVFVLWRILLFSLAGLSPQFFSNDNLYRYKDTVFLGEHLPHWVSSWANFDGVHYLTIGVRGYIGTGLVQAFFPLFPYIILHPLFLFFRPDGGLFVLVSLVLANVFTLSLALLWYIFVKELYGEKRAWIALLVLLFFPTAFFFGAVYTESLFLLLVVGSFLAAHKRMWGLAALIIGLATATRLVGIFLIPALLVEMWQIYSYRKKESLYQNLITFLRSYWRQILIVAFGALGLFSYMVYLFFFFHDPLYFFHVQSSFGSGRQTSLVVYPQVLWRAIKILLTVDKTNWRYLTYVQEFLAGTLGLLAIVGSFKVVRLSHILFALGAFFLPPLTGNLSSMPRYILVCFPIYLILASLVEKYPKLGIVVLSISAVLLIINTMLFTQGNWVA
jgi:Gpi18-like mannosyltransferase